MKALPFLLIICLAIACSSTKPTVEGDLMATWNNGKPRLIRIVTDSVEDRYLQKEFYRSGKLKAERNFKGNTLDGDVNEFFEDGTAKSSTLYRAGEQEGHSITWRPSGEPFRESWTRNGEMYLERTYYEDGAIHSQVAFDSTGVLRQWYLYPTGEISATGIREKGHQVGWWDYYDENGKLLRRKRFDEGGREVESRPGDQDTVNSEQGSIDNGQ